MELEFEFEYEEKENFTNEEVQAIVEGFKTKAMETISAKDEEVLGLTGQVAKVKELEQSNHQLSIKNLAIINNISDDMLGLILDDDLDVVKTKIELVKGLQATKNVENSYKPEQKRKDDDMSKLEKSGDVAGMLKYKLSKIIG